METHRCPKRDCTVEVPNRDFACTPHWFRLSRPVRSRIYATARLPLTHPERRAAIDAAREEWGDK
jgi:hypothetical protein